MLTRHVVVQQKIRWQYVLNDQWMAVVEGQATGERTFRLPSSGRYVIVGPDETQQFVADCAKQKALWDLGLGAPEYAVELEVSD